MKTSRAIKSLLTLTLVTAFGLCAAFAYDKNKEETQLLKEAKISKAEAQKTALKKVTDGTIKESELEKEHGKLIWSFDITRPGTKNITEVDVDAVTGTIVKVEVETPKHKASGSPTPKNKASGSPTPKNKASGSPTPKD